LYEVLVLCDYQEEHTFNRDAIIAADEANYVDPGTADEIALDSARFSLKSDTLAGNWLRNGGTVYFECVAVRLDADGKPVLAFPQL